MPQPCCQARNQNRFVRPMNPAAKVQANYRSLAEIQLLNKE